MELGVNLCQTFTNSGEQELLHALGGGLSFLIAVFIFASAAALVGYKKYQVLSNKKTFLFLPTKMWKQILIEKYQAACAKLTAAEIALFIHGDPDAIDYKADSLQEQVKIKFL